MPMELVDQVRTLGIVLRMERSAHLRRAFALFLTKVLLPKKTGRSDFPDVSNLVEVERMILEGKSESPLSGLAILKPQPRPTHTYSKPIDFIAGG